MFASKRNVLDVQIVLFLRNSLPLSRTRSFIENMSSERVIILIMIIIER